MLIVQLFNQPFAKVAKQLARMKRLGFSHILISPPQKSHASRSWWGRYQPVDFTRIEGPLGNAEELRGLCLEAQKLGLFIVVDAVLHHLSNEPRYVRLQGQRVLEAQYPRFSRADICGVHRLGRGRGLPILDTRSSWVRGQLRDYLHGLYRLGVRGFRFDSAKHIAAEVFEDLLRDMPPLLCFGELVYTDPKDFPPLYWRSMKAYDFPLAAAFKRAFAPGGDLGQLLHPVGLWGRHSIPFVNHHDLIKNRRGFSHFRITDGHDRRLAYAYLLARSEGIPLVYGGDLRWPEVKSALAFRKFSAGRPLAPIAAEKNQIAIRRGPHALAAINKAGDSWTLSTPMPSGVYRELITGWRGSTVRGHLNWHCPPRSATLLVHEGS